ncbi:serine/threonine-protein kinase ATM isoform X13 [Prunus dulcis]|uniref:serine/threonine-protein kinase ATM isoform X13 n=1 Tax=Prunus dulcis TaxID=3755 RepID=UPI001481F041|nr:serine/threonine-protein kinase ATM isoform X13 [Prunus dulcis]
MVISRDVQEIVLKLSSDKARTREEGIKLLNTWLEGERSIGFCKYLGKNTAELIPEEIPHSETWPFFTNMLIQCASLEISSSKRPKLIFAKTLRVVVQRAEDDNFSGKPLPLLPVVKNLFNHIWEVVKNATSFQSEYGIVLRHLLAVRDYRFHMRKDIYCKLVKKYMKLVEDSWGGKNDNQYHPKEEVFRCILTLHALLENPPGDFPHNLREDIVKRFVKIFRFIRDEGKISRKLIECINIFLIKDGPNLDCESLEIHNAVQQFVFRCWLTTHDRSLKDVLILYARLQLNITRGATDGSILVHQLLDIVYKELDQSYISNANVPRTDATKDDKFGTLSSSHCGLVELAAAVLYRACTNMTKAPSTEKRVKREHAAAHLREALMKGKWLWNASFCFLTHKYHTRISKDIFIYWFEGICTSFQRSLQELSSVLLSDPKLKKPSSSSGLNEESSVLNEQLVLLLPAAVYSLCAGSAPFAQCCKELPLSYSIVDVTEASEKPEESEHNCLHGLFDCTVEVLANIDSSSSVEVPPSQTHPSVWLPTQIRDPLLFEMETLILEALVDKEMGKRPLSDAFFICALLSNFIYGSVLTRQREEASSFLSKLGQYLLEWLNCAVHVTQGNHNDFLALGCLGSDFASNGTSSIVASLRSFVYSPIFSRWKDQNHVDVELYGSIIQLMERLLKALAKVYEVYGNGVSSHKYDVALQDLSACDTQIQNSCPSGSQKSRIVDMELDVNEDSRDVDVLTVGGKIASRVSSSVEKWKLDMILLISDFFPVLHVTWDVLFELLLKESDQMVREKILLGLCQQPYWSSPENVTDMVSLMNEMVKMKVSLKLDCVKILSAIHVLLGTLLSLDSIRKDKFVIVSLGQRGSKQNLMHLGDVVNRVAECDLLDWFGRAKLINCICDFVLLSPQIGQTLIERLLLMLQDPDYRVRFSVARRIDVLFQTWDGHEELFHDICSNFGVLLVFPSKEKLVAASEVVAVGPQPRPTMETVIITLMHLALHSEKIEFEAVFMICVVSAIDPGQRELVVAVLDNLSRQLHYTTRFKYLEELMGSILFCWIACGVSLAALVEIRQLFVSDSEPSYFMQYCCHWLLPALLLHGDHCNLSWVAKIACQPLEVLVKNHFVQIFSVCMALHCSKKSGWEKGADVLQNSILHLAQISENERDKLIKKNMVSIVSHILSLSSSASNPAVPFFSRDTIARAIQTVVDGFLEMEDDATSICVVDKINIFRADRVFMFIVELHHKIAAAAHHRHTCHRLTGVEVLIDILGYRAAVASTSNYLFNLVSQFIGCRALQDQCCRIISTLLKTFKSNPSKEIISVLGEQLQFLVSKLVACCIPTEAKGEQSGSRSSQVLSLLLELTVDSDPSLYDYIRELEPFPEIDIFDGIRKFHQDLCRAYSPRDHLLKFVKRSCYLPPRLLLWSLQALHKKFLLGETFQSEKNTYWHCDQEIIGAVWTLVRMCGSDDTNTVRVLLSDFISRVGIGDPHCVVFRLPGNSSDIHVYQPISHDSSTEVKFRMDTGLSEELVVALLKLLKKYLMDDSVKIVDMTSQALRGILSTQRGQSTMLSFDSYERSLIEVHSKGVNIELVEKFLFDLEIKFKAEAIPLENSTVWVTDCKTFDTWICQLVYSLIGYCSDVILRLCQDVVLAKAEVAELLLPSLVVNLAGRKDMDVDLLKLISLQVQEYIFTDSNMLIKSIQIWLNALNELRLCHVMQRTTLLPSRTEISKSAKPSSYSSKSRSTPGKAGDSAPALSGTAMATSLWDKVYWLSIDYLIVAKSAVICGNYFTAVMYVEHWCEEHFNSLTLGSPDFSHIEALPHHIEILVAAVTQINEPDSLYGIIQSHKLTSQIITFEHEGNWSKALEYYDLQVRSASLVPVDFGSRNLSLEETQPTGHLSNSTLENAMRQRKPYKGLIRSLQQTGCMHVLDLYCQGLTTRKGHFHHDLEFTELQYEAAWRTANWDFSLLHVGNNSISSSMHIKSDHFNENLHSCLRALKKGDFNEFHGKLKNSKQELVWCVSRASEESTEHIYSAIIKLQILYHLGMAWDLRWTSCHYGEGINSYPEMEEVNSEPVIPTINQLSWLNMDWSSILERTQLHMNLLEPLIAFRRVLLQILNCRDCMAQHLLQSTSTLRKGSRFSQAAAALHEFKFLCVESGEQDSSLYWLGRLEEAKLLRGQGQHEMAISLAKYVSQNFLSNEESSDVHRLVGKWLAETRSSNSRTILEKYLKPAVSLTENQKAADKRSRDRQSRTHFHLAHYADALFRSYEERLNSNEWQAAMRLRKHKTMELEALIKRLKSSTKGEKIDYSVKIQELQKQLAMDKEEAEKLQDDRDNFLNLALEGYQRCLVVGNKYDVRVVFRLISLWFSLSSRKNVIDSMLTTITEVQSYKFIPLVYQIASRVGSLKDCPGPRNFQYALVSLVKKMAIDHPYHTIFQLLALANGDRIKDKQRSRNSFVVDMDKKLAAENLLQELTSYHGAMINQMKQMVEIYIKLAELETKREDTNRKVMLPRELRNLRQLELVPVVTATFSIDQSCQYHEGSFPYFKGLGDSVRVMNGVNAPKVVECLGSDGCRYRQLAKSGNDDLRQDAVMEQFFGLVNTFLQNHRDTWKRRLGVRTYKVVPFTPSAGVLEWVDGTLPLGEYLIGSMRNGGAHGRYGVGDWSFLKCREHVTNGKDKRKAFQEVCRKFRPVMHHFFLERFLQPADWFEKRLAYTRSVATSSMVGYIVGLGDRHAMNILIDQTTAEVVHIDLGVAFEQGLMLKTPERVPFRLTRDIIDGMGVTGVEGVFRRCCEETLSVMRTNKEALLTIVEVFIHDPLYKWALSPLKALQRQKETDDDLNLSLEGLQDGYEGNKDAARALMRVKQKLDGYEEGEMRSIHGQVILECHSYIDFIASLYILSLTIWLMRLGTHTASNN